MQVSPIAAQHTPGLSGPDSEQETSWRRNKDGADGTGSGASADREAQEVTSLSRKWKALVGAYRKEASSAARGAPTLELRVEREELRRA